MTHVSTPAFNLSANKDFRSYPFVTTMGVVHQSVGATQSIANPNILILDTVGPGANRFIEVGEIPNKNAAGFQIPLGWWDGGSYTGSGGDNGQSTRIDCWVGQLFPNSAGPSATQQWGFQIGSFGASAAIPWVPTATWVVQLRARGDTGDVELIINPGDVLPIRVYSCGVSGLAVNNPWRGTLLFHPGSNTGSSKGSVTALINGVPKVTKTFADVGDWPDTTADEDCGFGVFATSGSNAAGRTVVGFTMGLVVQPGYL